MAGLAGVLAIALALVPAPGPVRPPQGPAAGDEARKAADEADRAAEEAAELAAAIASATLPPDVTWELPVQIEQLELLPGGHEAIAAVRVHSIDLWKALVRNWGEVGAALLGAAGATLLVIAIRRVRRPREPHCRRCRYRLVGHSGDRCPECGRALATRDRRPGPRRRRASFVAAGALMVASGGLLTAATRGALPRHGAVEGWMRWESAALFRWKWAGWSWRWIDRGRSIESQRELVVRIDLERGRIARELADGSTMDLLVHPDGESFFLMRRDGLERRCVADGRLQGRVDRPADSEGRERLGLDRDRGALLVHGRMRVDQWLYEAGLLKTLVEIRWDQWHRYFQERSSMRPMRPYRNRELPCLVPGRPLLLTRSDGEEGVDYVAWDLGETATPRSLPLAATGWAPGFSPDGCWLVEHFAPDGSGKRASVRVWDLDNGEVRCEMPMSASMAQQGGGPGLTIDPSARYVTGCLISGARPQGNWYLMDLDSGFNVYLHSGPHVPFPRFAGTAGGGTRLAILSDMSPASSMIYIWDLP